MSRFGEWWRSHRGAVLVAGGVVAALAIGGAFIWPITDLIAAHDVGLIAGPQRAVQLQTAREAVRTQLLTLAAGVFVAGALWFTAQNYRLSRQGQVTDRYTKAIEQLGSDKLDVRIGSIYALERIARDSVHDHPTVMEVLAAFIREHCHEQWPLASGKPDVAPPERATRPDVQAALTVIGRRDPRHDRGAVRLASVDLTRADLGGMNLAAVNLSAANLDHAALDGTDLSKASLNGARFNEAMVVGANFTDAQLFEAQLSGIFVYSVFTRANLQLADLNHSGFRQANFDQADLKGTNLSHANLGHVSLRGADLRNADLTGAYLEAADLTGALTLPNAIIPEGWQRDADSGRLEQADTNSGGATPS